MGHSELVLMRRCTLNQALMHPKHRYETDLNTRDKAHRVACIEHLPYIGGS